MNQIKRAVNFLGVSRLVVIGFLLVLMVSVFPLGINPGMIYSDCLVRIGMNGFLVLAMMVSIVCGAGLNFDRPSASSLGLLKAPLQCSLTGAVWRGFWGACIVSVPFALIAGLLYAVLLNNVKGSEMTVGNYMAFHRIPDVHCVGWCSHTTIPRLCGPSQAWDCVQP